MTQRELPKQYLMLGHWPVLLWSMQAFEKSTLIDAMCIVAAKEYHTLILSWAKDCGITAPIHFALPGRERFESAYAALACVSSFCKEDDILLFHDAARPLVTFRIIADNIHLARKHGAVYTAIKSQDSIFVSNDGLFLSDLLPRQTLWQGQTPQTFRYSVIARAHAQYRSMPDPPPVTDDCSLVHLLGEPVAVCVGDKRNLKITTSEDLLFVSSLLDGEAASGCAQAGFDLRKGEEPLP
jgi:2-C-methyl-D-erythritol 4-phosphate cytidylyltransferase